MMTLQSLLEALRSEKKIYINLYNNSNLLLISFNLPGYESVSPALLAEEVKTLELPAINEVKITLKNV